jgi:aryl-phospho-beta-D-glucosidase BglC (GH1 family)
MLEQSSASTFVYFVLIAFVAIASLVILFLFLHKERFMGEVVVVVPPPGSGGSPSIFYPWGGFPNTYGGYGNGYGYGYGGGVLGPAPLQFLPDTTGGGVRKGGGGQALGGLSPEITDPGTTSNDTSKDTPTNPSSDAAIGPAKEPAKDPAPNPGPAAAQDPAPAPSQTESASVDGVTIDTDWSKWKYKIVGKKLTLNDKPLNIRGINWYGFEEKQMLPELLYHYSMADLFKALKTADINAIRICISAEYIEYFDNPIALVGNKGIVIRNSATDHKTIEKYTVNGTTLVKADASNQNVVKYSYIASDQDLNGKTPAYALDKFLKMAYKNGMLVMVDLHTYTATPPWNDHGIHAGLEIVINDVKLAETVQPENYLAAMKVDALIKHKITDFVYPDKEAIYYSYFPYKDITQTKPINFPSDKLATLWAKMAKFCYKYPHVFAFDLKNEPHSGVTSDTNLPWQGNLQKIHGANFSVNWKNWAQTCNKWYEAINKVHPHCIIVVEGLNDDPEDRKTGYKGTTCWGNGFSTMKIDDIKIPMNRIIFSPHQYGSLAEKLETTKKDWKKNWGFMTEKHCVMMGEWAKSIVVTDAAAETKFMADLSDYMKEVAPDNFYFALNYTSGDTVALYSGGASKPLEQDKEIFGLMKKVQPNPTKLTFPFL